MAETEAPVVTSTPAKKSRPKKAKSAAPQHPKVSEMVNEAIDSLRERGGSSLQAIKKYVAANYKVDIERLSPFLKKYLRSAVVSGALVQTKGKGATGSFKMGGPAAKPATAKPKRAAPPKEKPVAKRSPKPKTIKKPAPKKLKAKASPKKVKAAAVKPKAVKSKKPAAKKSPAKKAKK